METLRGSSLGKSVEGDKAFSLCPVTVNAVLQVKLFCGHHQDEEKRKYKTKK